MSKPVKLLLVDDDPEIREIARVLLEGEGFTVTEAASGEEALAAFSPDTDLVILDVMMPGISGYQVCLRLRERWNVPILFLTAKTQDSDLVMGFSSGGDDYLSKPFSYSELIARVKGLLRRYQVYKGKTDTELGQFIEWRGLRLDREHNEVMKQGKELNLTTTEYQILRLMMTYRGKIFSAQNLYESVWEEPYLSTSSNTVMVHIRRLREKIEKDPQQPEILKTIWGKGYRIE
ncbi:MAG: response regulator transcription factor [Lawsonibacter sp.]|nr:response regulator transcription factor [Lawsonibacter sp.]